MSSQSPESHLKWPIRLTRSQSDGILVIEVAGRIGHAAAAAFGEAMAEASRAGSNRLILDLAGVDYISSAGLTVMHETARSLAADGGILVICQVTDPVRIALELAGLVEAFAIESSREQAVSRVRNA